MVKLIRLSTPDIKQVIGDHFNVDPEAVKIVIETDYYPRADGMISTFVTKQVVEINVPMNDER